MSLHHLEILPTPEPDRFQHQIHQKEQSPPYAEVQGIGTAQVSINLVYSFQRLTDISALIWMACFLWAFLCRQAFRNNLQNKGEKDTENCLPHVKAGVRGLAF